MPNGSLQWLVRAWGYGRGVRVWWHSLRAEASTGQLLGIDGCMPDLGREQSGGESVPAVAETIYRLWARRSAGARPGRTAASVSWGGCEGRHKAGSCGDLMGLAGLGLARHLRLGTCYEYRHQVGKACCWPGALRGRSPRTREGRIGPTAQTAVVSSQWSGVRG